MDRSEQYTQEHEDMRKVIQPNETRLIHEIVKRHCDELIIAALPIGRIDMVAQFTRPVAVRFIADYFGVPGPNEIRMMHWMRALFHDLFLNLSNDKSIQFTASSGSC